MILIAIEIADILKIKQPNRSKIVALIVFLWIYACSRG